MASLRQQIRVLHAVYNEVMLAMYVRIVKPVLAACPGLAIPLR